MATILFFIQSKKTTAGIYVRIREGRDVDAKGKTSFLINPEDWSKSKGRPKHLKSESLKKLNTDLDDFLGKLQRHYNNSVGKVEINTQWLKDFINPPVTKDSIPSKLVDYFDYYIFSKNKLIEEDSIRKYRNVQEIIKEFQIYSKNVYFVKDFNEHFRNKLIDFALGNKGYSKATVSRLIKFIKTVCYHAERNQIEVSLDIRGLKPIKEDDKNVVYLNPKEIKLIENANIIINKLLVARDWLIISIETGQRISDFMNFKKESIRNENGTYLLEFQQEKTKEFITVPLSKTVKEILKKWNGDFPPKQTHSHYNIYIKELSQIAGLNEITYGGKIDSITNRKINGMYPKYELITSHIGRRSFATNKFGNVPTAILMSITGHQNEDTFLKYIGKTRTEMSKLLLNYIK
jgi:integrase